MVEGRNNLLNKILPKITLIIAITLGLISDISIANIDLQIVTMG
jgi:hypothetical protein